MRFSAGIGAEHGYEPEFSIRIKTSRRILQEAFMKFMNFSRKLNPMVVRIGCHFGNTCFDITKAIGDDLLEFPRVVFSIEDVLQIKDGLSLLEDQLRDLKRSSRGIQS